VADLILWVPGVMPALASSQVVVEGRGRRVGGLAALGASIDYLP
jgi:hypothetical protein